MGSDLTQSEVDIFWTSSGFQLNKTMPFPNLIRQIIIFNRDENRLLLNQCNISFLQQQQQQEKTCFLLKYNVLNQFENERFHSQVDHRHQHRHEVFIHQEIVAKCQRVAVKQSIRTKSINVFFLM